MTSRRCVGSVRCLCAPGSTCVVLRSREHTRKMMAERCNCAEGEVGEGKCGSTVG